MSVQSWKIGDVKITKIREAEGTSMFQMIPDATPENILPHEWLRPHFVTETGDLILSYHALLVETAGLKVLVDTCIGNDKPRGGFPELHMLKLPFLETFEEIGCKREDVDIVLCTHMHVDHVGWNTMLVDGEWKPTFPNARYLIARTEFEHTKAELAKGGDDVPAEVQRNIFEDSIQPILDAGLVDLVDTTHAVSPEVRLVPTPGHTPGHVSVEISSGGQRAYITGDIMHHPCQLAHPEWQCIVDHVISEGIETRTRFCESVADSDTLVIGTHWAGPSAGQIVREGQAYKLALNTAD